MTQKNVGSLVVVKPGEEKLIAGILTERGSACLSTCKCSVFTDKSIQSCNFMVELNANADYLRKIIVQGRSSKSTKVGEIMTAEVDSCSQSSPIIPFLFPIPL